jgi:hypothetical protein
MSAINYVWSVDNLERICSTGVVVGAAYTVKASDKAYRSSLSGTIEFDLPDEEADYVPYFDLTHDQVVGWIKDKIGEENLAKVEDALTSAIQEQRQPSRAVGVPWPTPTV